MPAPVGERRLIIAVGIAVTAAHQPRLRTQQVVGLAISRYEPVGMLFGDVR
jgi:hypothetical protein